MATKKESTATANTTIVFATQEAAEMAQKFVAEQLAKKYASEATELSHAFYKVLTGGEFTLANLRDALKDTPAELMSITLSAVEPKEFLPAKEKRVRLTDAASEAILLSAMGEDKYTVKTLAEKLSRPESTIRVWIASAEKANKVNLIPGERQGGYRLYIRIPEQNNDARDTQGTGLGHL
jgi:hypothetical protein